MRRHAVSRFLHLWLSIPTGIVIVIMCLYGALPVFERDYSELEQGRIVSSGRQPLELDVVIDSAAKSISDNKIVGVTIYADSLKAYKVMLAHPAMAALWVDQYSGCVLGEYRRPALFQYASAAHRRLFARSKSRGGNPMFARTVVGITSILLIIIVITGMILWFPKSVGQLKKKLTIPFHNGRLAFWRGLHCAGGAMVAVFLLLCALTGLTWSFKWYNAGFYALFGAETAKPARRTKGVEDITAWQKAYERVAPLARGKEVRIYEGEIDVVRGKTGNRQAVDTYYFNGATGAITNIEPYESKSRAIRIKGWIYSLHVGSWGGLLTKVIYLIAMFVGAMLPLTGYYLWIKRSVGRKSDAESQIQNKL